MKTDNATKTSDTVAPRTVAMVGYHGAELLDMTGPIEVFNMLNRCLEVEAYRIVLLAESAGPLVSSSGLKLMADAAWGDDVGALDTIVVPGSPDDALVRALECRELIEWLGEVEGQARRVVSVCTGAFLLAEAGLLDGRRVTTHWMDLERLGARYPKLTVEPDAIFVRDGKMATSAGVTAGLDLALALVEEDFGRKMALTVARRLVMYLKRPGGQAQFSTQLRAQMVGGGPLAALLAGLRERSELPCSVEQLAGLAAMSPRNFARVFVRETGSTPARFLDQLRLERAIALLEEENGLPIASVARKSGFSCAEQLRRTFIKQMGITPIGYRKRFCPEETPQ